MSFGANMDSSKTRQQFKRKKGRSEMTRRVVLIFLITLSSLSMILFSRYNMSISRQMQTQFSIPDFDRPRSLDELNANPVLLQQLRSKASFQTVMNRSDETTNSSSAPRLSEKSSVRESIAQSETSLYFGRRQFHARYAKKEVASPPTFPAPIKLPFPVFVASLFKSGTTAINAYFQCGGQRSVHWETDSGERTGKCLFENIRDGKDPFAGCGDYDIWTDNSFIRAPSLCWDPSITNLDAIYQAYPNATIILTVRDPLSWTKSVIRWGKLFQRLTTCQNLWPEQPENKSPLDVGDIHQFYLWQIQHVRDFAAAHPSMTFLEVSLDDSSTALTLEERIGIPSSCWGKHNENNKISLTKEKLEALKQLPQLIQ